MKKTLIVVFAVILLLAGIIGTAWFYLPTLVLSMIGKAIGGSVQASRSTVSYKNGLLLFSLEGVSVKGKVEGRIGQCDVELVPSRIVYIKRFSITDFDVKVKKDGGRLAFYPVPVELAEIRKGLLDYDGRKYTVRELRVTNFNTGKTMEFTLDGGIEGIGDVKTHGEGLFGEKRSDIKGDYSLSSVNMARVLKDYEGFVASRGHFTYRDGRLVMDGDAEAPYFSLMETFLLKRVTAEDTQCRLHATWADGQVDLSLGGLFFKGAPLSLRIKVKGKKLLYLALAMDYVRISDVTAYIDLSVFSDKDWGPLSYVKDGEVRVESLVFAAGEPVRARIALKDTSGGDGHIFVSDVEGSLQIDGQALLLSDFEGRFGEGRFYGVSGVVPLKNDHDLRITGRYVLSLRDLNRFNDRIQIEAKAGTAEGVIDLKGRRGQGFKVETAGVMQDGRFLWKGLAIQASTDYAFAEGAVTFERLLIKSAGTDLALQGKAQSHQTVLKVKGTLDGPHITRLFLPGRPLKGPVDLNGDLEIRDGAFSAKGRVNMTSLAFEIPGVMKKGPGVESVAYVSTHGRADGDIFVDDLYYTMDEMKARASFDAMKGSISNLHLVVDAPRVERLSRLFFFDRVEVQGDLKADVLVKDLPYPVTRLPVMKGALTLADGGLRLPSMANPFKRINLACSLDGERFVVDLSGLQVGASRLAAGRLVVDGLDAPAFSLTLDMARFDPLDFATKDGKPFRLPVINEGGLMSRVKGAFLLKAAQLDVGNMTGRDFLVTGSFADRTLLVNEGGMKTAAGSVSCRGNARFVQEPRVNVTGELKDLSAQEAFSLFGASTDMIEGTGSIKGTLRLVGRSGEEMARSAAGTIEVSSRDGVIRKWNLLSKLLALTNVYDLLRGRVDLSRDGLVYRKLSGSFTGQNGLFRTENFLIESPSMIIAGQGDIDAAGKTVDARMVVSPLVEMDRLIGLVPVLRSIVKDNRSGFVFFAYDVKGPVSDPEVTSSYIQSMGRRAFNILWNTIRLPKSLVDSLPGVVESFPKGLFEK